MNLPIFGVSDDPGPNFTGLLGKAGLMPRYDAAGPQGTEITHGTTVVAARFADGVMIAGDRRATAGNFISHRNMEKVFQADRWSGVAISGAAGPAVEMVKLFRLQLEHYEKVEGHSLSLEGKANQLSQMLRGHLPAALQGMVVIPIFAGYDRRRGYGRLFAYDVTGGRYEEDDFVASGSGSLHARTVVRLGHHDQITESDCADLLIRSLFTAADEDSATGGPDNMRGIYPIVAAITADGYRALPESEVADRFAAVISQFAERA